MNWTNEKPTKPGWYWYRERCDFTPWCAYFYFLKGEITIRDSEKDGISTMGQFAGPIPEPSEPDSLGDDLVCLHCKHVFKRSELVSGIAHYPSDIQPYHAEELCPKCRSVAFEKKQ